MRENMRLIHRKCGGWLAVSNRWADIKIGVAADTESEAREKYEATVEAWRKLLAGELQGEAPNLA